MGGRRFRLNVCKYQEPKKPKSFIVSIKLTRGISVFPISLPRELYLACPVSTLAVLKARLEEKPLLPHWFLSGSTSALSLFKIDHQHGAVEATFTVCIDEHLQWSVNISSRNFTPLNNPALASIPPVLASVSSVMQLFALLDSCRMCMGNSEQKFLDVARHRGSIQQGTTIVLFCFAVYDMFFICMLQVEAQIHA